MVGGKIQMMHGLNNTYLYAAKKIVAKWTNGNELIDITGTGFIILKNDNCYLITNRHIVEPAYLNVKYSDYKVIDFAIEYFEDTDDIGIPIIYKHTLITNWNEFKFHQNIYNDVACLKSPKTKDGMSIFAAIPYNMLATETWFNQKLSVCDSIAYTGFPAWYDKQNNTPIFRMGTIASDPRLNYSYVPGAPVASRVAYEGFSTSGASGSPIFAIQRGFQTSGIIQSTEGFYREVKLIGINAGHFRDQEGHSGISYFYKSSVILDLIDSF